MSGHGKCPKEVHPGTGHEGPEMEYRYSSIFCLTSTLDREWLVNFMPRHLSNLERDLVSIV